MATFKVKRYATESSIPDTITNGTLHFAKDTGRAFMDYSDTRVPFSILVDDEFISESENPVASKVIQAALSEKNAQVDLTKGDHTKVNTIKGSGNSAGANGYVWLKDGTSLDGTSLTLNIYYPPDVSVHEISSSDIGTAVSVRANYTWSYCGTISSVSGNLVSIDLDLTTVSGAVPSNFTPIADPSGSDSYYYIGSGVYPNKGYLWFPEHPDWGYENCGENHTGIGEGAFAIGNESKANQLGAFVSGDECIGDGKYSITIGEGCTTGYAGANFGYENKVRNLYAFSAGVSNKSTGNSSATMGRKNEASGPRSVAMNAYNKSTQSGSAAFNGDIGTNGTDYKPYGYSVTFGQGTLALDASTDKVYISKVGSNKGHALEDEGDYWRRVNISSGKNSFKEGVSGATGDFSHAEGRGTRASGLASHSEGYLTTASGNQSHAEGNSCTASGNQSHVEGYLCKATASQSHAEGNSTEASGTYSHAEGYGTKAKGSRSHVEGGFGAIPTAYDSGKTYNQGETCNYNGKYYVSLENGNVGNIPESVVDADKSAKWVEICVAENNGSHAEGFSSARANFSHSEGYGNEAKAQYSHVEGFGNRSSTVSCQHIQGRYNIGGNVQSQSVCGMGNAVIDEGAIFIIGIGNPSITNGNVDRKNGLVFVKAGTSNSTGTLHVNGEIYVRHDNSNDKQCVSTSTSHRVPAIIEGTAAPTTSTAGLIGDTYVDTTNKQAYICVGVSGSTFTWKQVTT